MDSSKFFVKYLDDLKGTEDLFLKANRLVTYLSSQPVQAIFQLEEAEKLRPLLDRFEPIHWKIIEGYSKADPQKSLDLLKEYQSREAKGSMINNVVPALLGMMYFYRRAGHLLSEVRKLF